MSAPVDAATRDRMVEALVFAAPAPMTLAQIQARLPDGCDARAALASIAARHAGRGVELVAVAGGWAFRTAPDLAPLLSHRAVATRPLSRAATETLAIVAYHQPVSRAEIESVRGVAVSRGTLGTLMDLGWVGLGPRREGPGRPATYVVTRAFLDHFGLATTDDLPRLHELRAAGLLGPTPPRDDADP